MVEFEMPSAAAKDRLHRAFAAYSAAGDLLHQDLDQSAGFAPSRLYRYALASGNTDPALAQALGQDLRLRRAYRALEQSLARLRIPALRAASSGGLPQRRIPGCYLRLEPSAADTAQYYLIIEFDDASAEAERPTTLVLVDRDETCHRIALPAPRRGVVQQLIDGGSMALNLLRDPQTEVLLR